MHAKRQEEYKKDLKAWYDQKKSIEENESKFFNPTLNPKTIELSKKRDMNVIEHAREYAKQQRVDLDTNTVEYLKSMDECTFKPHTKKVQVDAKKMGRKNLADIIYPPNDKKS